MRKYTVMWKNTSIDGAFPMSAEFYGIDTTLDCLKAMMSNSKNVEFNMEIAMVNLGLMYSGDLDKFSGPGFMVTAVNVR